MKRIVASVVIRDNYVVNAYGFSTFLPIGRIENIIRRLQDWEVDEIAILNTSHSENPENDFERLMSRKILGEINTPISYGGGIFSSKKAEKIIRLGCERVILASGNLSQGMLKDIRYSLGEQAILIHWPVEKLDFEDSGLSLEKQQLLSSLSENWGGEFYFKLKSADGSYIQDSRLLDFVSNIPGKFKNFLVGGGLSNIQQVNEVLNSARVSGVVIGNWLNRQEIVIPRLKKTLTGSSIREYSGEKYD